MDSYNYNVDDWVIVTGLTSAQWLDQDGQPTVQLVVDKQYDRQGRYLGRAEVIGGLPDLVGQLGRVKQVIAVEDDDGNPTGTVIYGLRIDPDLDDQTLNNWWLFEAVDLAPATPDDEEQFRWMSKFFG